MGIITKAADALVAFEWLGICVYFVRRYFQHRKLVSLALAAMSLGWLVLGLSESFYAIAGAAPVLKVSAFFIGAFIWFAVWRVEKHGR